MRKPLPRLEILLLERRIQYPHAPYLPRTGRVVAFYIRFGFAVGGLEGEGSCGLNTQSIGDPSNSHTVWVERWY